MANSSQKKLTYIQNYEKENVRQYRLRFNKKYDKEIIEFLDAQPNKIDYIRQLILKDMGMKP